MALLFLIPTSATATPGKALNAEQTKILANIEYLIAKLPADIDLYKRPAYGSTPAEKALDGCDYSWRAIARDYRRGKITRAEFTLFRAEENNSCLMFPTYAAGEDSARELLFYQKTLLDLFGDPELVRLNYKCASEYHSVASLQALHNLPPERVHAYVDDCMDHGYPFLMWNASYSKQERELYAKLSNYIVTKILRSKDRLLNSWMFSVAVVFSPASASILADKDLIERLFEFQERKINLGLNIIFGTLLNLGPANASKASFEKLDQISIGIVHRMTPENTKDMPDAISLPMRVIAQLILLEYYNAEQVDRMAADPLLMRAGYSHDIAKYLAHYYFIGKNYQKALQFYMEHQRYQKESGDTYFKEEVDEGICMSNIALNKVPPGCVDSIQSKLDEATRIIRKDRNLKTKESSILDLSKLTILQQDTIDLTARIRQYFVALVGLSFLMTLLCFFLFRIQLDLRRKNQLIANQRDRLEQKNREIQEQKDSIRHILDEIDEVILKFDSAGQALPYSSSTACKIFPGIESMTVYHWIDQFFELSPAHKDLVQEALRNILNEPIIAWELNGSHLPNEVKFAGEPYALLWTPVFRDDKTHELLISARSLVEFREVEQLKQEQTLLLAIISGGPAAHAWIQGLPHRLQNLAAFDQKKLLARQVHTIKGEARSLRLAPLVEACHQLEQTFADEEGYQRGLQSLEKSTQSVLDQLKSLSTANSSYHPTKLTDTLEQIVKESRDTLAPLGFQLQCLLLYEVQEFSPKTTALLSEILLHAISNSLDHGFIRPRQRHQSVPDQIQLKICIQGAETDLLLSVEDNGWGLDEPALMKLAKERQWQPAPGRPWSDIVFESGVSSAQSAVSLSSGRGVGLSAVQQAAEELGLQVTLGTRSDQKHGTRLNLSRAQKPKKSA